MASGSKRVYLVRHAESDENVKLGRLRKWFRAVTRLEKPAMDDLLVGASLLSDASWVDSQLSDGGRLQVAALCAQLREMDLLAQQGVELVMHSPLIRAKLTCTGVLASDPDNEYPLLEHAVVREKTVLEWVPGFTSQLDDRIAEFGKVLAAREETCILVVGHSQFFRRMLGHQDKMKNCDVWCAEFELDPATGEQSWNNAYRVMATEQQNSSL